MATDPAALRALLSSTRLHADILKAKGGKGGAQPRHPAGSPLGGQWVGNGSKQGGLFDRMKALFTGAATGALSTGGAGPGAGVGAAAPYTPPPPMHIAPMSRNAVLHPAKGDKGEGVYIQRPTQPSEAKTWNNPSAVATFVPGGKAPASLGGIPMKPWVPGANFDWSSVPGQNKAVEAGLPDIGGHKFKHPAAGVIIQEDDGRIWLTRPTNGYGGYRNTFPKGTQEKGLSLQQTAIKEAWEETGLKIEITGVLGDVERTTSIARFYTARRVGGSPSNQGWESQALRLAPLKSLKQLLNMPVDKDLADTLYEEWRLTKGRAPEPTPFVDMDLLAKRLEAVEAQLDKAKGAGGGGKGKGSEGGKKGHWETQPRWPAGTPLGGKWKTYDANGIVMPPQLGKSAAAQGWQTKINNAYAAAVQGDYTSTLLLTNKLVKDAEAKNWKSAGGNMGAKFQSAQYLKALHDEKGPKTAAFAKAEGMAGPAHLSTYKKNGAKPGGSNPGGVYSDKAGTQWLVKGANYPSDDRAKNEVLAAKLMQAAGIGAPDMHLVDLQGQYGGGLGVAAKMEPLATWMKSSPDHLQQAQSEFAVHVWLANYDAVGQPAGDNLGMVGGKVFNYDPGGALLYRAQGLPKSLSGGMLDHTPSEWHGMRDKAVNAAAASVYGSMSATQLKESAAKLQSIDDKTIKALVDAHGPGDAAKKAALTKALIARRNNILVMAGLAKGGTAVPLQAAAPQPAPKPAEALKPAPTGQQSAAGVHAHLINTEPGHNKFWKAQIIASDKGWAIHKNWGPIGKSGQFMVGLPHGSLSDAKAELYKQVAAKLVNGYQHADKAPAAPAAPPTTVLAGAKSWFSDPAKAAYEKAADLVLGKAALDVGEKQQFITMLNGISAMGSMGNDEAGFTLAGMAAKLGSPAMANAHPNNGLGQTVTAMSGLLYAVADTFGPTMSDKLAPHIRNPAATGPAQSAFGPGNEPKASDFKVAPDVVDKEGVKQSWADSAKALTNAFVNGDKTVLDQLVVMYDKSPGSGTAAVKEAVAHNNAIMGQYAKALSNALATAGPLPGTIPAKPDFQTGMIDQVAAVLHTHAQAGNAQGVISAAADGMKMHSATQGDLSAFAKWANEIGTAMGVGAVAIVPFGNTLGNPGAVSVDVAYKAAQTAAGFSAGSPMADAAIAAATGLSVGNQGQFDAGMKTLHGMATGGFVAPGAKDIAVKAYDALNDFASQAGLAKAPLLQTAAAAVPAGKDFAPVEQIGTVPKPNFMGVPNSNNAGAKLVAHGVAAKDALKAGDLTKLNEAYAKMSALRDTFPIGSKGRMKAIDQMIWVQQAAKPAGLKVTNGQFQLVAGAAAPAAPKADDPIKQQAEVMLGRLPNITDGAKALNSPVGNALQAGLKALDAGDDKGLASAIGGLAIFGTSTAVALSEKLTAMAEAKGGFPMATGSAATIISDTGGAAAPAAPAAPGTTLPPAPPMPVFQPSTPTAVAYYTKVAAQMQVAYEKGDLAALQQLAEKPGKQGQPLWPVYATGAKVGQPKTVNGELIAHHFKTMEDALKKTVQAKTEAAMAEPATKAVPAPGESTGGNPAMPKFTEAKLKAGSNTNAASHNAKVDAIAAAAAKGDVKGILALNFATNTYGKKQAALANDALAALGSPFQVDPGQKKHSHPALTGGVTAAAAAKSGALTEKDLPAKLDFANWNGPGKGLSSKAAVNEANQANYDKLTELAKAGDLNGLKNATFQPINAETGQPTGQPKPISEHPSQHIKGHQEFLLQVMDEKLNPPKPLEVFEAKQQAKTVAALAAKCPPKPLGSSASKEPSSKTIGHYIAIGQAVGVDHLVPKKTANFTPAQTSQGHNDYSTWKHDSNAKAFQQAIQGSGGYQYHKGWDSPSQTTKHGLTGAELTARAKAAHKWARKQPAGTKIYKWENLSADMKQKLSGATPGLIIQNPAPSCASRSSTATKGFGSGHRWNIIFSEGAKGFNSYGSGSHPGEQEVTLLPNHRFMIIEHKPSNGYDHAETTVLLLPPDPALDSDGYGGG